MIHSVKISGTVYELRFTFASLVRMEEEQKVNVYDSETYRPSPRLASILIWGGVIHAAPHLTPKDVTNGIAMADLDVYGAAAINALMAQLPRGDAKPTANA